jgi:purine-binding chemotaxis protein CheW
MDKELQIVGFRVGRESYGVPITSVHEIVRVPEITAVPDAPDYLEGVINLRGKIVSIIDLRKRFGEPAAELSSKNRVLVTEINGKLVGLIVDAASEVLKIRRSEIETPPNLTQEGRLNCITGVGKFKGRLIILVDLEKLLTSPQPRKHIEPTAGNDRPNQPAATLRAQAGGGK